MDILIVDIKNVNDVVLMRYFIKFIVILCFLPIMAFATGNEDATNTSKYTYGNKKHKIEKKHRSNIEPIEAPHSYAHKKYLDRSYYVNKASIKVEGIEFSENIDFIYKKYLNKQITHDEILSISEEISKYFLEKDYLLPQVTINEKELRKGNLKIRVRIESIKEVVFIGETNNLIQNYARKILASKPTTIKNTQRYLVLMNIVPGYDVKYKLQENVQDEFNKHESLINLVITTEKTKAESFANIDNYGANNLGKMQIMNNSEIFSAFMPGDSLSFTGLTTNHPERLYDVGLKYGMPVNEEGTRVYFSASHAEDNITKTAEVTAPNSFQSKFGFSIMHPLYLTASKTLEVTFGTYYSKLVNYGLFSFNSQGKTDTSRYWSADLGLEYLFKDQFAGHNIIHSSFVQGLDGSYNYYEDPTTIKDRHFNLYKFDVYRQQELPKNFSLFGHVAIHYSDKNIPDQELFGLGGRDFGRGYEFFTIDGTQLIAFSMEARYSKPIEHQMVKELEPYLFYDVGYVGKQDSDTDITNLSSTGAGLRIKLENDVNMSFEVAQPLKKIYNVSGSDEHASTRLNMFVNKTFKF